MGSGLWEFPGGLDGTVIDISQPVTARSAVFPGDVPFSREITETYAHGQVMNLTAFTMSPHVGTHADAPVHIGGDLEAEDGKTWLSAGRLPLEPYFGSAWLVDVSPCQGPVTVALFQDRLKGQIPGSETFPGRILFKTRQTIRYDVFEEDYAWIDPALVIFLKGKGVCLVGLDTPSVDPVDSKTLETHHALLKASFFWLENLDLSRAAPGEYLLVALPLKLMDLEASPVRAVLVKPAKTVS